MPLSLFCSEWKESMKLIMINVATYYLHARPQQTPRFIYQPIHCGLKWWKYKAHRSIKQINSQTSILAFAQACFFIILHFTMRNCSFSKESFNCPQVVFKLVCGPELLHEVMLWSVNNLSNGIFNHRPNTKDFDGKKCEIYWLPNIS